MEGRTTLYQILDNLYEALDHISDENLDAIEPIRANIELLEELFND